MFSVEVMKRMNDEWAERELSKKSPKENFQVVYKISPEILNNLLNLQEEIEDYISIHGEDNFLAMIYDKLEEIISPNL